LGGWIDLVYFKHMKASSIVTILLVFGLVVVVLLQISKSTTESNEVVVYVSHDQDYSEPILKDFEAATGIKVKAVYDTEASKTVGLTNRLIAEKENPKADVFWNNEVTRTVGLNREGVLAKYKPTHFDEVPSYAKDPDGYWTGFAARARVLLIGKDKKVPERLEELVGDSYKDMVTIADPRFGTTGSHIAALWSIWGEEKTKQYFKDLKANGLNIAQSNGQTRDKVVSGEKLVAFTDTDDANDAVINGDAVTVVYPNPYDVGTLVIPNTVMLIKGAPHKSNAQKLIDYLISPEVESQLAFAKSAQMPLLPGVKRPETVPSIDSVTEMNVVWSNVYDALEPFLKFFEEEILD